MLGFSIINLKIVQFIFLKIVPCLKFYLIFKCYDYVSVYKLGIMWFLDYQNSPNWSKINVCTLFKKLQH